METLKETHQPYFDHEMRHRHDAETWLAEVLDGRMVTQFSYNYDPTNNELYAEDGSGLTEIFKTAISDAEKLAQKNPNLGFELRRRHLEDDEREDMLGMMQGGSNTMVVVSDFPAELMNATEDVGGYNVSRKQTMLRIITRGEDNNLTIKSLSLDGSNRAALEKIYEHFGLAAEDGELLGQRIYEDLDPYQQEFLSDSLVNIYDESIQEQFGGEWRAGRRQPDNPINTYDFVCAQTDLIDHYVEQKNNPTLDGEMLQFAVAAEMERRWLESEQVPGDGQPQPKLIGPSVRDFEHQLWLSAMSARAEGKVYSGCGASVGGAEGEMGQLGYGNKANSESDQECEFISKKCPECNAKNVKTKVTKTKISGSCGCSKSV